MNTIISKQEKRSIQSKRAIITTLILLIVLTAGSQHVNAYTIANHWTCKDVDESSYPYKPIEPTTVFYDSDERVSYYLF